MLSCSVLGASRWIRNRNVVRFLASAVVSGDVASFETKMVGLSQGSTNRGGFELSADFEFSRRSAVPTVRSAGRIVAHVITM